MSTKFSTGLRNHMLVTGSFKDAMDLCSLKFYSGAVPVSADSAIGSAVLLLTVTNDATATGLTFADTATDGVLTKDAAEIWRGFNVASGTASFFRFETAADDGSASTVFKRVQGLVATVGAEANISSVTLVDEAPQVITYANVAFPTA